MKRYLACFLLASISVLGPAQAERICLGSSTGAHYETAVIDAKNVVLRKFEGEKEVAALKLSTSCEKMATTDRISLNGMPNCVQSGDYVVDKPADSKGQLCQVLTIKHTEVSAP